MLAAPAILSGRHVLCGAETGMCLCVYTNVNCPCPHITSVGSRVPSPVRYGTASCRLLVLSPGGFSGTGL